MARLDEVAGVGLWICKDADRGGAVFHANACAGANSSIHGDCEISFKKLSVLRHHALQS